MLELGTEVARALREGEAVVALESTIISHGLPPPRNIEVARELENVVREQGAVPATVGVIWGRPKVGLEAQELELLAFDDSVAKLSARDLPFAAAKRKHGGTTVAATARLASSAGILLFATGGLGGVHRDARDTRDVSADLAEISRSAVAVVCSGVKSILDIPATLEELETLGVPIAGYRISEFPAFYLQSSGVPLDWVLDSEKEAAETVALWREYGGGGMVIANAVSAEEQLDPALHDRVLEESLQEARSKGVRGKEVTPFVLSRFVEKTGGESLKVNRRLVVENARLAARIAVAMARSRL